MENHIWIAGKEKGRLQPLHGIERARQIPKNKKSSSHDVVQVNEIGIEFAINNIRHLRNTAEKRKKEKEEKEKIPE